MSKTRIIRYDFTGGAANALDSIDGANLLDLDEAHVYNSGNVYHYVLEAASGATENSPYVIAPDANPGTKRWILYQAAGTYGGNTDVDTGTETVDSFPDTAGDGCVWEYSVKKTVTNTRFGYVQATWNSTLNTVEYTEMCTPDIGDTTGLTLTVDINSGNVRFLATATSDNWSVKFLRRLL